MFSEVYSRVEAEELLTQYHLSHQSMLKREIDQLISMIALLLTQPISSIQREQHGFFPFFHLPLFCCSSVL